MRRTLICLTALLTIGFIGVTDASAAKKDKKKAAGATGQIQKIEGKAPTLTLTILSGKGKKAAPTTVSTDDRTSVTVDGQAKTLADLKVGEYVKVNSTSGTVSTIDATSKPADKAKKAKKDKKKKV